MNIVTYTIEDISEEILISKVGKINPDLLTYRNGRYWLRENFVGKPYKEGDMWRVDIFLKEEHEGLAKIAIMES